MCDFLKDLFGSSNQSNQLMQMFQTQQAQTKKDQDAAAAAATEARQRAEAAMVSPADSEAARQAAENQIRRTIRNRTPYEITQLGAPPVAYTMLMGQ